MRDLLVFDVGGTCIRGGIFDASAGCLVRRASCATPNHIGGNRDGNVIQTDVLASMERIAASVLAGSAPDAVAVAYAGPVHPDGSLLASPTILGTGLRPFPLLSELCARWGPLPVLVMNDVTAAGYRYVGDGSRDFCVITVSSGIGHKIFLGGRPVVGPAGRGGEIGHWRVDFSENAVLCDCGGFGHLGAIASGRGVLHAIRRRATSDPDGFAESWLSTEGQPLNNDTVATAFRAQDEWVRGAVRESARALGQGIAALHLAVGVERVVILGGFALALGEDYRRLLVDGAVASAWDLGLDWDHVLQFGANDDDHGLIGAGACAAERFAGMPVALD